jgi:hypothetical protein
MDRNGCFFQGIVANKALHGTVASIAFPTIKSECVTYVTYIYWGCHNMGVIQNEARRPTRKALLNLLYS